MHNKKLLALAIAAAAFAQGAAAQSKTPVFTNVPDAKEFLAPAKDAGPASARAPEFRNGNAPFVRSAPALSAEVRSPNEHQFKDRVKVVALRDKADPAHKFDNKTLLGKINGLWIPQGMAKSVNALTAMRQVLPPEWKVVDKTEGRLETSMVQWNGKSRASWLDHVNDFALKSGTSAVVDLDRKTLTLQAFYEPEESQPTFVTLRDEKRRAVSQLDQESERAVLRDVWILKPSLTLKENLKEWVKAAGWNGLAYEADDFPVSYEVRLTGKWDSPAGPIAHLANIYERTALPLVFTLKTGNKVLHVSASRPSLESIGPVENAQRTGEMEYHDGLK